jgi:hypothetical protein
MFDGLLRPMSYAPLQQRIFFFSMDFPYFAGILPIHPRLAPSLRPYEAVTDVGNPFNGCTTSSIMLFAESSG